MAENNAGEPGRTSDGGDGHIGRRWLFGSAVFDELTLELCVEGRPVEVEKKPLEVLAYLLRHAGEVVTKDELAEQIWPGRLLTESVLSRCVSALRSALKDDQREIIKTVHGYGYRLVAEIKIEAIKTPSRPAFTFVAGDSPPLRPHWKLAERLGSGSHGEAWLARHEQTGETRVFKFALNQSAFASMKREVTLYRVLRDNLGASIAVARIIDWNLEEQPYFLEMEYVAGRDLAAWAESQGGLATVPMETRLELAAQIAEALGAAHSVGVLHKDLKPGNVLVEPGPDPKIRLCDFGSGGIIDASYLEKFGISRLGFTETLNENRTLATPLYSAPEIIGGQPATPKSDIYALGVVLYQILAGDLRKPLTVGWESDIREPLLRTDIAEAANGESADRLSDAGSLANRLRTLEERRERRIELEAKEQRTRRALETVAALRRMQLYACVLALFASVAIAAGLFAHKARNEAIAASISAKAINDFLTEDVLRVNAAYAKPTDASYEALIKRAASEVDKRLSQQPDAAARVHFLLGRRLQEIGQFEPAVTEFERAAALLTELLGRDSERTLLSLDRLAAVDLEIGRVPQALALSHEAKDLARKRYGPRNLTYLMYCVRNARTVSASGHIDEFERELRELLKSLETAEAPDETTKSLLTEWFGVPNSKGTFAREILIAYVRMMLGGVALEELGDNPEEATALLDQAIETFVRVLGERNELTALAIFDAGGIADISGNYIRAEHFIARAGAIFDAEFPARHFARGLPNLGLGRVRLGQHRIVDAMVLFDTALRSCTEENACPNRIKAEILWELGQAEIEAGQTNEAVRALTTALDLQETFASANSASKLRVRVALAEALLKANRLSDARNALDGVDPNARAALRPHQLALADLRRIEGLLALKESRLQAAAPALAEAVEILSYRVGNDHWRTVRTRNELALARTMPGRKVSTKTGT